VRWLTAGTAATVLLATVLTAVLLTACGTSPTAARTARQPSAENCLALATSALRSRVVVRRRPPACADLTQAQVNQLVGRAIRTVIGPHPKAIERRLAAADSRYLGDLVRPIPPPRAAPAATGQPATTGALGLRFAALAAWLATAIPGGYLLAGWLVRDSRRRAIRRPPRQSVVPLAHAGLAISGLLIWIGFTVTRAAALAWTDVGLTWVIAGLGMASLLTGNPEQAVPSTPVASTRQEATALAGAAETAAAPFPTRAPVITIASHGTLAMLTILLVLLATIGIG
jgi:manganese efflux pump family protein